MDNKITCPNHDSCEKRLCKLEERYDELKEQVWEFDKKSEVAFAKVTSALENLADLPKTMAEMTNTMIAMNDAIADNGTKTDDLAKTVKNLSNKVNDIDNKDKVSIMQVLKDNWLMIAALLGCALLLGKDLIASMFA